MAILLLFFLANLPHSAHFSFLGFFYCSTLPAPSVSSCGWITKSSKVVLPHNWTQSYAASPFAQLHFKQWCLNLNNVRFWIISWLIFLCVPYPLNWIITTEQNNEFKYFLLYLPRAKRKKWDKSICRSSQKTENSLFLRSPTYLPLLTPLSEKRTEEHRGSLWAQKRSCGLPMAPVVIFSMCASNSGESTFKNVSAVHLEGAFIKNSMNNCSFAVFCWIANISKMCFCYFAFDWK